MMTRMKSVVLVSGLVAGGAVGAYGEPPAAPKTTAAAAESVTLKVGDPAPPFSLVGSDGKTHTLAEFKGKKAVVLAWFPKAFTGG